MSIEEKLETLALTSIKSELQRNNATGAISAWVTEVTAKLAKKGIPEPIARSVAAKYIRDKAVEYAGGSASIDGSVLEAAGKMVDLKLRSLFNGD